MKNKIIKIGVLATALTPLSIVVSCGSNEQKTDGKSNTKKTDDNSDALELKRELNLDNYLDSSSNNNGKKDINMYDIHIDATYTVLSMTRHAFLSKNKAILLRKKDDGFMSKNIKANIYNEYKGVYKSKFGGEYDGGEILDIDTPNFNDGFIEVAKKYALENKERVINIFINKFHALRSSRQIIDELVDISNVKIHLIPDGSSAQGSLFGDLKNSRNKTEDEVEKLRKKYDNVYSYSYLADENEDANRYYLSDSNFQEIQDELFDKRLILKDENKENIEYSFYTPGSSNRLSSIYSQMIGTDINGFYKDFMKIKNNPHNKGKDTLLVFGSYAKGMSEIEFLKHVLDKYGDKYIVFYKGHPRHHEYPDAVIDEINNGVLDLTKQKMIVLNTDTPSEEFTNNYVTPVDGVQIQFDKFIAIGATGAVDNLPNNGYNKKEDVIGMWEYGKKPDYLVPFPWKTKK